MSVCFISAAGLPTARAQITLKVAVAAAKERKVADDAGCINVDSDKSAACAAGYILQMIHA